MSVLRRLEKEDTMCREMDTATEDIRMLLDKQRGRTRVKIFICRRVFFVCPIRLCWWRAPKNWSNFSNLYDIGIHI